jgi:hypothetical protein
MRWFTDAAYKLSDRGWDRMLREYTAHLEAIAPRLAPDLAALATDPRSNLHDARFHEVRVDRDRAEVDLIIDGLWDGEGYRRLTLQFDGAAIVPDNLWLLAEAVGAEFRSNTWHRQRKVTEIMAQEVDVLRDGRFVLRLRLSPFYEFGIEFDAMTLTDAPLGERARVHAGRFRRGPRRTPDVGDST